MHCQGLQFHPASLRNCFLFYLSLIRLIALLKWTFIIRAYSVVTWIIWRICSLRPLETYLIWIIFPRVKLNLALLSQTQNWLVKTFSFPFFCSLNSCKSFNLSNVTASNLQVQDIRVCEVCTQVTVTSHFNFSCNRRRHSLHSLQSLHENIHSLMPTFVFLLGQFHNALGYMTVV